MEEGLDRIRGIMLETVTLMDGEVVIGGLYSVVFLFKEASPRVVFITERLDAASKVLSGLAKLVGSYTTLDDVGKLVHEVLCGKEAGGKE